MNAGPAESAELPAAAIAALHAGNKIEAIKHVRLEMGVDLKQAKDRVDDYVARHPVLQEQLRTPPGSGLLGWVFMLLVAIAAIVYFWPD